MREAIPSAISSYFYYGFTASCIIRESLSGYFATEIANYSAVSIVSCVSFKSVENKADPNIQHSLLNI